MLLSASIAFTRMIAKLNELKGSVSGLKKYSHINTTASETRDIEWSKNHPTNPAFIEIIEIIFLIKHFKIKIYK